MKSLYNIFVVFLTIRQYKYSDHNQVVELHKHALRVIGAYKSGEWEKDLQDIEGNYINNKGEFLVGLLDSKVIAMGAIRKISDEIAELKRMRVHPDFQRQGFGQWMLEALEKRAKELGYKRIQLDTTVKQTVAQYLYEKNGYSEIRRETWIIYGEVVFYQKALNS